MENRKLIKYLIITGVLLAPVFSIQAYNDETTHPALTQEVIKYFEYSFPEYDLSEVDKKAIKKGSIKEDSPEIRCLNHFYDPIYKKGLKDNMRHFIAKNSRCSVKDFLKTVNVCYWDLEDNSFHRNAFRNLNTQDDLKEIQGL